MFDVGQRVSTPHGAGTIDNKERCNDARSDRPPRMVSTGRYGVKLDDNPFVGIKDGVVYYWPNELGPEKKS